MTFVGGGFSGVEGFGELLSLATALLQSYPELSRPTSRFHLVEARGRILPEVRRRARALGGALAGEARRATCT